MNNIETLKLALEYLQDNQHHIADNERHIYVMEYNAFIERLERIIAEAEQAQPVVWMYQDKSTHEVRFQKHMSEFVDHSRTSEVPLYGEPLANHELQCVCGAVWCGDEMVHLPNKTPPRQPLTEEEIEDEWERITGHSIWGGDRSEGRSMFISPDEVIEFVRATEAAHGIRSNDAA